MNHPKGWAVVRPVPRASPLRLGDLGVRRRNVWGTSHLTHHKRCRRNASIAVALSVSRPRSFGHGAIRRWLIVSAGIRMNRGALGGTALTPHPLSRSGRRGGVSRPF